MFVGSAVKRIGQTSLRQLNRTCAALPPSPPAPTPSRPQRDRQRTENRIKLVGIQALVFVTDAVSSRSNHLAAKLHVLVAPARQHHAVAAGDKRERGSARTGTARTQVEDRGGIARIATMTETELAEAIAAKAPRVPGVVEQKAVREAAGEGGYAQLGAQGTDNMHHWQGGGGGGRGGGSRFCDEHRRRRR